MGRSGALTSDCPSEEKTGRAERLKKVGCRRVSGLVLSAFRSHSRDPFVNYKTFHHCGSINSALRGVRLEATAGIMAGHWPQSDLSSWRHLNRIYGSDGEKRLQKTRILVLGKISPVNDVSHTLKFYEHFLRVTNSLQLDWVGLEHATLDWISSIDHHGPTVVEPYPSQGDLVPNLAQINIIIYLERSGKKAIALNEACRQAKAVAFIWATSPTENLGLMSLFVDPGLDRFSINPDGLCRLDSKAVFVGNTTKASPPLIACNIAHELESGQKIRICGEDFIAEVVSSKEFYAIQVQSGSEEKRVRRAISGQAILKVQSVPDDERSYNDLKTQLWDPSFPDYIKPEQLGNHEAFLREVFPEMPPNEIVDKLAHTSRSKATLTQELSTTWEGPVSVSYGFLASQICHQILNLSSLRFPPLKQWSHFKCPEVTSNLKRSSVKVAVCGLGHASVILLEALVKYSKQWISKIVLCGDQVVQDDLVANASPNIFRKTDIGKPVGVILKDYLKKIDSTYSVEHFPSLVPQNLSKFPKDFFETSIGIILSCDESWDNRRFLGEISVRHKKPLLDFGTDILAGHVQSIVPHRTESYNCVPTPIEHSFPFCVIKSFPQIQEHAIVWAFNKIESLFHTKPVTFNEFWNSNGASLDELVEGQMPQESLLIKKILDDWQSSTWNDCVTLARNKFEKYFNHKARQLLVNFPSNARKSTNDDFWAYPKQEPHPVSFDPTNETHLNFILELAKAFARMMNIQPLEETNVKDILGKAPVQPFVSKSKTIVTDDSVSKEQAQSNAQVEDHDIFNNTKERQQFVEKLKNSKLKKLDPNSVDISMRNKLLVAFAQLRCEMYGLAKPEPSEIFYTANHKCPCLPSTLSIVVHLVIVELFRISSAMDQDGCWPSDFIPMNYWFAGLTSEVLCAPSPKSKVIHSTHGKFQWSLWNDLKVQGWTGMTVQELLDFLMEKHDLDVTMVVQGSKMIYVQALPMHAKRKTKQLLDFVKGDTNKVATLNTTIRSKQSQDDVEGPPIQLRLPMQ